MNRTRFMVMLEQHEGRRKKLYRDTVGKWTIGVGYNIDDRGLPDDIIDMLFDRCVTEVMQQCIERIDGFRALDEVRQHVLLDMAFNLGVDGLLEFKKMLAALARHDYDAAAREMLDSRWAKQVGSRADELARMMRTGEPWRAGT